MSYDVSFKQKKGKSYVTVGDWLNYTSNTGEMIKEVVGSTPGEWDQMSTKDLAPKISEGIFKLCAKPEKYKHLEPSNGWGSVEGTITFLQRIYNNCLVYPDAIVEVDY